MWIRNGNITPSFLKENDIIISGEEILSDGTKIAKRNNLGITLTIRLIVL